MLTELREMYQNSRLIVYDPNARNSDGIKYFRSGAHGYLSKNIDSAIFKNCVETVMDGKFYIDPRDLHMILERSINASKLVQDINNGIPRLTQRQGEIASCFAQGMSTSQIAKKLGLSSSTISTVKARIYEKLKIDNIVDLKEAMLY
jgi:DNA-binding NarL/FixJ family response regulator